MANHHQSIRKIFSLMMFCKWKVSDLTYLMSHLCEDTETVVDLLSTSGSHIGKVTGGDGGEDATHRVPDGGL